MIKNRKIKKEKYLFRYFDYINYSSNRLIFIAIFRVFPWECAGMLVRGLLLNKIHPSNLSSPPAKKEEEIIPTMLPKDPDTTVIHQQLTRRISSSERKP